MLKRWIFGIIAFVLFLGALYSLVVDLSFFVTKKEAYGKIVSIDQKEGQELNVVTIKYYNVFLNKSIECNVKISFHDNVDIRKAMLGNVKIFYGRWFPQKVYLADYKVPKVGIVLLELVMIILMIIAIYGYIKP